MAGANTHFAPPVTALSVIARDRDSGVVVGRAVAVASSDGVADVAVAVAEAYADHEIGRLLVEHLKREARQAGMQTFRDDALGEHVE